VSTLGREGGGALLKEKGGGLLKQKGGAQKERSIANFRRRPRLGLRVRRGK